MPLITAHRAAALLLGVALALPSAALADPPAPPAPKPATPTPPKADRCAKAREGAPCGQTPDFCVLDMGEPCGWSEALWCRDGVWALEKEANLCEDALKAP